MWAVKSPTYSAQSERAGPETVGCGPERSTAGCIESRKPDNGATIRLTCIKEYRTCIKTCLSFPRELLLNRLIITEAQYIFEIQSLGSVHKVIRLQMVYSVYMSKAQRTFELSRGFKTRTCNFIQANRPSLSAGA